MGRKLSLTLMVCFLVLLASQPVWALDEAAGQAVPWFFKTPSAKSVALGNSQAVVTSGAAAIILNPANLSWQGANYLSLMHTEIIKEVNQELVGMSYQWMGWNLGLAYQRIEVKNIEEYDEQDQYLNTFNNVGQALTLAVSKRVHPRFSLGGSLSLIGEKMMQFSGRGYAAKISAMWQVTDNLLVGGVLTNPIGEMRWVDEWAGLDSGVNESGLGIMADPAIEPVQWSDPLPTVGRIGAAYYWPEFDLTVLAEYLSDRADAPLHIGIEKGYMRNLRFRIGLDGLTPTMGLGLKMSRLEVDYAFVLDQDFGKRQYLSLNWQY